MEKRTLQVWHLITVADISPNGFTFLDFLLSNWPRWPTSNYGWSPVRIIWRHLSESSSWSFSPQGWIFRLLFILRPNIFMSLCQNLFHSTWNNHPTFLLSLFLQFFYNFFKKKIQRNFIEENLELMQLTLHGNWCYPIEKPTVVQQRKRQRTSGYLFSVGQLQVAPLDKINFCAILEKKLTTLMFLIVVFVQALFI